MTSESNKVIVIKLNTQFKETWRYTGHILKQGSNSLLIEAYFNRKSLPFHGITLKKNDRFLEVYYDNRWYNIFEIHDRDDDHLKAWYCNVSTPAVFSPGQITYVDLALDVLAFPDGNHLVLDKNEFTALALEDETRAKALTALETLIALVESGDLKRPFRIK